MVSLLVRDTVSLPAGVRSTGRAGVRPVSPLSAVCTWKSPLAGAFC